MPRSHGVPEIEIQHAILECMKDGRVWTNADLKRALSHKLPWSDEDLRASTLRPSERMWENRVNNSLSPSRRTSLYARGHVEKAGFGEHRITDAGRRYINGDFSLDDLLDDLL